MGNPAKYLTGLFAAIILICGCDKEDPPPFQDVDTVFLDTDVKNYFVFDSGAVWIYQDTSTLVRDTVSQVYSKIYIDSVLYSDGSVAGVWESYDGYLASEASGDTSRFYCNAGSISADRWEVHELLISEGSLVGRKVAAIMPFAIGESGSLDASFTYSTERLDSLSVGDSIYYDVIHFTTTADATQGGETSQCYYANGKGLVRRELSSGEAWLLESYHLNP